MKKILYMIAVSAVLFTACKKGTLVENTEYEKLSEGDQKYSYIKILNLTTGSPVVNFYMNGDKFSSALSSSGIENAGYGYNGLYPGLGYATVSPGANALTAKVIPTATADPNLEVFNTQIKPAAGKYYTIVTNGQYDAANKKIPSSLVLEDFRPATDTTKIFVRIANMSLGTPNMDVLQEGTDQKIASNVAYGKASEWVTIANPGKANKYVFVDLNTNTRIISPDITLTKGRAYTIYTRGTPGDKTYPFTVTFYTTFY